jgi:adenine-specific DNA-methyltransferase
MDFFSGSATTAHAVMQLNAEDGGHRKFIMVQLPEETDEKSEAYKAGYKNICEIGKERIRRAGAKIIHNSQCIMHNEECLMTGCQNYELCIKNSELDVGFRVLKCDTTNMKDVYYKPTEYQRSMFGTLADNIKEDRTPEDLLFQVMLDLGILLSSKIQCEVLRVESDVDSTLQTPHSKLKEYTYFNVADGFLIACFDENVTDEVITAIAKQKPYYFVMRDSSMASDSVATNFEQIFETYSPTTERRVL